MAQNTFDFAHFWSNLSTILSGKANASDLGAAAEKGFDASPTSGHTDYAVSSDGVYQALAEKANTTDLGTAAVADTTTSIAEGGTGLPTAGTVYAAITPKIKSINPENIDTPFTGTVCGWIGTTPVAGISEEFAVLRSYKVSTSQARYIQILENAAGMRKTRFYNDAGWGSWS